MANFGNPASPDGGALTEVSAILRVLARAAAAEPEIIRIP